MCDGRVAFDFSVFFLPIIPTLCLSLSLSLSPFFFLRHIHTLHHDACVRADMFMCNWDVLRLSPSSHRLRLLFSVESRNVVKCCHRSPLSESRVLSFFHWCLRVRKAGLRREEHSEVAAQCTKRCTNNNTKQQKTSPIRNNNGYHKVSQRSAMYDATYVVCVGRAVVPSF